MTNKDITEALENIYYDLTDGGEIWSAIDSLHSLLKQLRREAIND
tara:strand:- start:263 stop:397 length:135 start_codon:yes stop_codon:yes gene_type:complete